MDAEVIVAGGGPAGTATAALLARAGHDVLLLDRAHFPRDKACAEYLSPATADVLDRLGALDAVEAQRPTRPLGMQLIVGGRSRALVRYPDEPACRRALCLSRRVLDATLVEHARYAGVRVLEGWQIHRVAAASQGMRVIGRVVGDPAGRQRLFDGRVVVGADGARSVVARSLGLEQRPAWPDRIGLIAHYRDVSGWVAQADGRVTQTGPDEQSGPYGEQGLLGQYGEMHVGTGAYCGLAPLPDGLVSVGLVMGARAARHAAGAGSQADGRESEAGTGTGAAFRMGLARVPGAAACLAGATRVGSIKGVVPLARRVRRVTGEGFVLVGDAAGFLDPFTGEGVFRALRGAELAAEVIGTALRQEARGQVLCAAALAPYAALRRREFAAKEALCRLIQGMLLCPPLLGYALRRLEQRRHHGDLLGSVLGDYRPAHEALRPAFLWGLLRP